MTSGIQFIMLIKKKRDIEEFKLSGISFQFYLKGLHIEPWKCKFVSQQQLTGNHHYEFRQIKCLCVKTNKTTKVKEFEQYNFVCNDVINAQTSFSGFLWNTR